MEKTNNPRVRFLDRNCPSPGSIREVISTTAEFIAGFAAFSVFDMNEFFLKKQNN
jgi:hypothetical protein